MLIDPSNSCLYALNRPTDSNKILISNSDVPFNTNICLESILKGLHVVLTALYNRTTGLLILITALHAL